jgi:hypothetical protein
MYFDRSDVVGTGIDEQISFSLEPVSLTVKPTITRQLCSIHFSLQKTANTTVTIYNSAGLRQKDVFCGILQKGPHSLTVAASDLPAGLYFLVLRTSGGCERAKFIVAR